MHEIFPEETFTRLKPSAEKKEVVKERNPFYPHGAIAFFVVLVVLCLVIWFGIYYIMLQRI